MYVVIICELPLQSKAKRNRVQRSKSKIKFILDVSSRCVRVAVRGDQRYYLIDGAIIGGGH